MATAKQKLTSARTFTKGAQKLITEALGMLPPTDASVPGAKFALSGLGIVEMELSAAILRVGQEIAPAPPPVVASPPVVVSGPIVTQPVPTLGDVVVYPSPEVGVICGPQLRDGSPRNPWPWFDTIAVGKGHEHGQAFPASQPEVDTGTFYEAIYYDQILCQYLNFYRTSDPAFRDYARKIADAWYASKYIANAPEPFSNSYISPRGSCLSGLMLRALDGRPEMWPGLTKLALDHYGVWLGSRLTYSLLHEGVRDGGFALLHVAQMAKVHPDAAVRADMALKARDAARDYYARLQKPDGGWYWDVGDGAGHVTAQPMMVGMLLEGLIAVHQLTNDPDVLRSIIRAVDWLWEKGYEQTPVTNLPGVYWRAMRYFVVEGQPLPVRVDENGVVGSALKYGMKDGAIRDARQLNPLTIHAFGYAYRVTSDLKYKERGDEIFAATFGKGQGPGADAYYGLADYRAKEYCVSYRSAGRYLVDRQ